MMRITAPAHAPARSNPKRPGVRVRVLAGPGPGVPAGVGMIAMEIAPGAELPSHAHGDAETLVHVVSGVARVESGDQSDEVAGGCTVHLPPGTPIAIVNPGARALHLTITFSPQGFERRFTDWAVDETPAEAEPEALLDLTRLPRPQRHRTVIAALEALAAGTPLVIVTDHEPGHLRIQLERRYGPRLGWAVRERAPERVVVALWLAPDPDVDAVGARVAEAPAAA